MPPLEWLRGFEACARLASFSRAAEEIGITQAAMSLRIRDLEARLGAKLFHRTRPRVSLTREGLRLSAQVRAPFDDLRGVYARWHSYPLVSISSSQRTPLPDANWYATVQHGMLPDHYQFSPRTQGGYLAFLGRISPEKRPDRAIEIAKAAGVPLKIAAKVDAADRAYFDECIRPLLAHPLIDFVGEIGDSEKSAFLGGARALLFPIDWPEPFGLVMIEAMACGTPVIAWRCGSVPEVVEHGVSGLIVDDIAGAVKAVHGIGELSRTRVRRAFDERFTAQAMANRYARLYWQLVGNRRLHESEVA